MTRALTLSACLAAVLATSAQADSVDLRAPLQGATLHDGSVDLSVYRTEAGEAHEVVAYYLPKAATGEVGQLRMQLRDGDSVSFKLPGQADVTYRFARTGDVTTVSAETPFVQIAAN